MLNIETLKWAFELNMRFFSRKVHAQLSVV